MAQRRGHGEGSIFKRRVGGKVVGWIDLSGLLKPSERVAGQTDVLNGIAYDAKAKRLFVTGKMWPAVFEIELVRK